ncbi:MAG: PAS domain S-box protein [Pseudomonadota bacterium]
MLKYTNKYGHFLISIFVFIIVCLFGAFCIWQIEDRYSIEQRNSILEIAASHAYTIERQLSRSLSATYALASMLRLYGELPDFNTLADDMITSYGGISCLQLAPQGIVTRIFPLKGNEKALGHNLLEDPARRTEALKTIKSRELTLAGPFELVQGGVAVIGRLPVFSIGKDSSDSFWGFTIVLIRLSKLLEATQVSTLLEKGYSYELSRIDPDSGKPLVFSRSGEDPLILPVSFSFHVPNGDWAFSLSPKNGWQKGPQFYLSVVIVGFVGMAFAFLSFVLMRRSELVERKSIDLESSNKLLREREEKYRNLFNNAEVGMFRSRLDGSEVLEANNRFLDIVGMTWEETLGKPSVNLWADPKEREEMVKRLVADGSVSAFEYKLLNKRQGGVRNCLTSIRLYRDQEILEGSVLDITDRRQAEDALQRAHDELEHRVAMRTRELMQANEVLESEITERKQAEQRIAMMSFALDNVHEAAYLADENGRFHYVNEESCRILGYTRDELLGLSVADIDPDFPSERWPDHWNDLKTRHSLTFECYHKAKDGRIIPGEINTNYFEYDGRGYNLALVRNISERKQAEKERLGHLRYFKSMDQVNRAIQGTNDLEQMMSGVLDTVLSIFDCDRASLVYPCDPAAASWQVPMERTRPAYPGVRALGVEMPVDPDIAQTFGTLLASSGPVKFGPGSGHQLPSEVAHRFGIQSFIGMALHPKADKPWEFVLHQCSYPRVWTPEEELLFQEIGRRLTDALTSLSSYQNLLESEARYRRIVDTASEGIWMLGEDLMTTFVNVRMAEMIGYQVEEMIGRSEIDFMFEEDAPDHHRRMDNRRRGMSEHYERRFRHRNGRTVWTQVSAVPVLDAGKNFKGTFGMLTDITERKQMEQTLSIREQEYRTLVENIPDLIVRYDRDLRRVYVNPAWEKLSGLSAAEVIDVAHADVPRVPTPVVDDYVKKLRQVMETGKFQAAEFTWVNAHGVNLFLEYVMVPECDQHGEVASILAVGHDITERKRAEEAIRKLNEELEKRVADRTAELVAANKELEAFAYSVSHDLRAPLRGIDGFSQILLEEYQDKVDEQGKDYLQRVRLAAQRMAQLIDDLLGLSRVTRSVMMVQEVNLSRMAQEIADDLQKTNPERRVEFVIHEGIKAQGDGQLLRIVLGNLLGNAWKFTSNHPTARIEFGLQQQEETPVYFVRDDGAGFDMKYVQKLFGAFQRLHTAAEFPGTGIGLATVQRIVHRHGGNVWAKGAVEKGATFFFRCHDPFKDHKQA